MRVRQAFRFELDPNRGQRQALARHVGAARWAYNWGLALCLKALEEGRKIPSAMELHKAWNRWKRENAPWWQEVSKCAPQEALRDLERAFRGWRAGRAGLPRFKRKKAAADNKARLTGVIRVEDERHVRLPRIGRVRTKERTTKLRRLLEEGRARVLSATVSREADRWYVSLTCEVERPDPAPVEGDVVGVDVGLKDFAVLSDGERIPAPRPLERALRLLRRRARQLARKRRETRVVKDEAAGRERVITVCSRNYEKAALRLARLYRRIRNIRMDFLHQVTTRLAKTKSVVVVEDLAVGAFMQNGRVSRSVADVGWGTFRRLLGYKTRWYGSRLVEAPRRFPSTRMCSRCGWVRREPLPLHERTFRCGACGMTADRDLNAALNLQSYGLAVLNGPTGSSPGSHACGDRLCGGTGPTPVYEHPVGEAGSGRSSMEPARVK
ncbi:hypothetical protein HRbin11_02046 [bacterium HR11]|nr:hypothetical protein HRbin11_02046 [bacterium HR11]